MLGEIQQHIARLADDWANLGQWTEPNLAECIDFIIEEAGEAHSAKIRLSSPHFTRNHIFPVSIADVDEEVADCLIMCIRYFNIRGRRADEAVLGKLARMDQKKRCSQPGLSPELRSIL